MPLGSSQKPGADGQAATSSAASAGASAATSAAAPARAPAIGSSGTPWAGPRVAVPLLLALSALLMLYGLARTPFRGLYDDVDRSLIARTMADRGDWVVPVYLDHPLYTKPPLMYWVAGLLYEATGRRDELPAALASVLGSLAVVLATWAAGRALLGDRAGLMAGLVLLTSYLFLSMARQPAIDTVMMAGFALSFWAVARAIAGPPGRAGRLWVVALVGLGLSTLAKGPVTLPLLILMSVPLWDRRPRRLPSGRALLLGLGLLLLIVLPWPIVLLARAPEARAVMMNEFFGRVGDHFANHPWTRKPWWFYLSDLGELMPWLPLLPAGLVLAWRRRRDRGPRLLLWWAVGGFLFFSLASANKRSYYLLPLYPAFALLVAAVWEAGIGGRARGPRYTASVAGNTDRAPALSGSAYDTAGTAYTASVAGNTPGHAMGDVPGGGPGEDTGDAPGNAPGAAPAGISDAPSGDRASVVPRVLLDWGIGLAAAALVLLGLAAAALPLRYDVHPAAILVAAGALAIGGGILALVRLRRGRRGWSFVGVLIAITALELAWFGEVVPPLNAYMGGEPFYREARAVLRESGAAPTAPPVASPASPALPLAVCHASLAMTAFYLDHPGPQDWPDAAVVQAKVDEGRRGWLVADPRQVEGVTGLEPVLVRTLRSPFGQTRQLGLYRLPGR